MTLRHIRIFITVYREMNITKAAGILHMTQPAVTRAIQEIEFHYGVQLFERLNHKLYRTKLSDELFSYALHIMDSFELMEKKINVQDQFELLRIGSSITLGNCLMPEAVCQMQKKYPSIQFKVTVSNGDSLRKALLNNQIDLAFIEGSFPSEYLFMEPFTKDHLVLIMPPGHPLSQKNKIYLKDLPSYPLLLREKGSAGRNFLDHIFESRDIILNPIWESSSTQALSKAVGAGLGISLLPEQLVKEDILAGRVLSRNVEDEKFIRINYVMWHKNKYLSSAFIEFIDLCREISTP